MKTIQVIDYSNGAVFVPSPYYKGSGVKLINVIELIPY